MKNVGGVLAPLVLVVVACACVTFSGDRPARRVTQPCNATTACRAGEDCLDRGDGARFCMARGAGEVGDSCFMDDWCRAGLHCLEWDGRNRVCMGKGQSGDPCHSSFDCAAGSCEGREARRCR